MRAHQRFDIGLHPHRVAGALPGDRSVVLGCASTVRLYGDTGQFVKGAHDVHVSSSGVRGAILGAGAG